MPNLLGMIASWLGRRAQPAPLNANHPFFQSADYKAALAGVIQAAFADGENAEKARVTEILQAAARRGTPAARDVSRSRRCDRRSSDLNLGESR